MMIKVLNHTAMENCNIQLQFHDYTLSVLVGKGSYSKTISNSLGLIESKNVEIAIMNDEGDFILPEQVIGHQSIQSLTKVMALMCCKHDDEQALVNNILAVID